MTTLFTDALSYLTEESGGDAADRYRDYLWQTLITYNWDGDWSVAVWEMKPRRIGMVPELVSKKGKLWRRAVWWTSSVPGLPFAWRSLDFDVCAPQTVLCFSTVRCTSPATLPKIVMFVVENAKVIRKLKTIFCLVKCLVELRDTQSFLTRLLSWI